jgi:hypothetical protein
MSNRRPPRTKFGSPPQPMRLTPNPKAARPAGARLIVKPPPRAMPERTQHAPPPRSAPQPRPRHALSAPQAPTHAAGDPALADLLHRALDAAYARDADADTLTHGFHSYPARMHPAIARVLIHGLSERTQIVVDPFCGSGTVVLESMVAGRRAVGVDLNPLAMRICEQKTMRRDAASRRRFTSTLVEVAKRSEERVRARVNSRAPVSPQQAQWWEGHVLKELAGLRLEIIEVPNEDDRRALEVLLSAIVVKFSKQQADTAETEVQRRIRKGLPTEFFVRKGKELVERWAELDAALPKAAAPPWLILGDARNLRFLLGRTRAHAVITSPPYGGTYDYARHHARRLPWLGLDVSKLERDEIGARSRLRDPFDGERRWDSELHDTLSAISECLEPRGTAALLLGDAEIAGKRIPADDQLRRLAPKAGLQVVATASQARPDWRGGPQRAEHLIALRLT